MRNLSWDGVRADGHEYPPVRDVDQSDSHEINPPEPLQIFTRLGVLLMIALAFGLVAELLVRLPLH
jgi:hypothetical protein